MTDRISFAGQSVVVTGAGGGLGRSYALELARRGASVVVNDPGVAVDGSGASTAAAESVVAEIEAEGGTAVASFEAVGTPESGERIVAQAVEAFGRIDAAILNAGILRSSFFEDTTLEDFESMISTHLAGAFWTAQAAYRRMKEQRYGRLVFVASNAAVLGNVELSAYSAAKGGVFGLSNTVALEGREYGIQSNALMPMASSRMVGVRRTEIPELTTALADLRERMSPDSVTPLVVYLASDACSSTHGVFSAAVGRYARAVVGLPVGWASANVAVTAEDVREHWQEIEARNGVEEPESTVAELLMLARQRAESR